MRFSTSRHKSPLSPFERRQHGSVFRMLLLSSLRRKSRTVESVHPPVFRRTPLKTVLANRHRVNRFRGPGAEFPRSEVVSLRVYSTLLNACISFIDMLIPFTVRFAGKCDVIGRRIGACRKVAQSGRRAVFCCYFSHVERWLSIAVLHICYSILSHNYIYLRPFLAAQAGKYIQQWPEGG